MVGFNEAPANSPGNAAPAEARTAGRRQFCFNEAPANSPGNELRLIGLDIELLLSVALQ